jgi:hypothetical protein
MTTDLPRRLAAPPSKTDARPADPLTVWPLPPAAAPPICRHWLVTGGVTWRSTESAVVLRGAFEAASRGRLAPEAQVAGYGGHEAQWDLRGRTLWLTKILWHAGGDTLPHAALPAALALPRPALWLTGDLAFARREDAPGDGDAMIERMVTVTRVLTLRAGRVTEDRQFVALPPAPAAVSGRALADPFAGVRTDGPL